MSQLESQDIEDLDAFLALPRPDWVPVRWINVIDQLYREMAGVYGMNFENMPELAEPWAYPAVWGVFIVMVVGMLWYFRRKGWIGKQ